MRDVGIGGRGVEDRLVRDAGGDRVGHLAVHVEDQRLRAVVAALLLVAAPSQVMIRQRLETRSRA